MMLSTPARQFLTLALLLLAGPALAQDNLISFGDFESLDAGDVTTIDGSFIEIPDNSTLTVDDGVAYTGDQSLRADYGGGAANFYNFQLIGQPTVEPGQEYTASVWARGETDGATFSFGAQNPSDFSNLGDAFYGAALTTEWQQFSTTFTVPEGVTSLNIAVAFGYDDTNVGNAVYIDDLSLTAAGGVAREDGAEAALSLQAAPNPAVGSARISFETPTAGRVSLQVFDATGRLVRTLVDAERPAGPQTVAVDASDLANGMYLYRLVTDAGVSTKVLTVVR